MHQPRATTMELPVKLVREIAILAFEFQRTGVKEDVLKVIELENGRRSERNLRFLRRARFFKMEPMLEPQATYESWKQQFLDSKLSWHHASYNFFDRSRTSWWKRLRQFTQLPEADDGKTIWMSMEDLSLIDYAVYLPKVTEEQK